MIVNLLIKKTTRQARMFCHEMYQFVNPNAFQVVEGEDEEDQPPWDRFKIGSPELYSKLMS